MKLLIQSRLFASASALTLIASAANAQTESTPSAAASAQAAASEEQSPNSSSVGDIIVTAQRRSESIQRIPIAIQAVQGQQLAQAGVAQIAQLSTITPGFAYSSAGSNPTITLRGIGSEIGQIAGESSVALQLDGAPLLRLQYLLGSFFDVERVEVLRGPQGTIAGRNATGGVINIISRRPTFTTKGEIEAGYGNYDSKTFSMYASGPVISDKLAAHFAVERHDRDGFINNSVNGQRLGGADDIAARASLLARPSDRLEILLSANYFNSDDQSPAYVGLGLYNPALGLALPVIPLAPGVNIPNGAEPGGAAFGSTSYYDSHNRVARAAGYPAGDEFKQRTYGFNGQVSVNVSDATTLKSVTAYNHLEGDNLYDSVRGPTAINAIREAYDQHQFSEELVLTSSLGKNIDVLFGGQFLDETARERTESRYFAGETLAFAPAFASLGFTDTIKLRSYAVFGQVEWRFAPTLQLTLGGRYTSDRKAASGTAQFPINGPIAITAGPLARKFDAFTPRIALDWKPSANVTAYISASKGFKAGGFGSAIALGASSFEPETVWNYEAGVKTSLLEGRANINLTGFWADYKNLQYGFYISQQTVVKNAGAARNRGVELETSIRPAAGFEIGFNATYLDAKFRQFCAADPGQPTAPLTTCPNGTQGLILDGNTLPKAPKFSLSGNASYRFEFGTSGALTLRGDVRYQSKIYFTAFNFNAAQPGYAVVNARAIYDLPNGLSFSAFVTNAFNKSYFTSKTPLGTNLAGEGFLPLSTLVGVIGQPRMYGGTIGFVF